MSKIGPSGQEQELLANIFSCGGDPFEYVIYAFPWGVKGTPLANQTGPRKWQLDVLGDVREHIVLNKGRIARGEDPKVFQLCRASGRGVGKSALLAWLALWFLSTVPGGSVVITANTEDQLKSRTFAEIGKWLTLAINGHWFEKQKMKVEPAAWFSELLKKQLKIDTDYYYADGQLWNEDNPGAFAGVHNHNGTLVIFDEAATIPGCIWDVTSGFFSDVVDNRYWLAFSNPRLNTGAFFECFRGRRKPYWNSGCIDSRDVEGSDLALLQQIIDTHGEDSDTAKVEVKGMFPSQSSMQFIGEDLVDKAMSVHLAEHQYKFAPVIIGVDPAWTGDDNFVIFMRQGLYSKKLGSWKKNDNDIRMAGIIARFETEYKAVAVHVDGGYGTGIVSAGATMGRSWDLIWFSEESSDPGCLNKRAQMWNEMKSWMKSGGCLENDETMRGDLMGPEIVPRFDGVIQLESKNHMKTRGVQSPNDADALGLTFARAIVETNNTMITTSTNVKHDFDPYV